MRLPPHYRSVLIICIGIFGLVMGTFRFCGITCTTIGAILILAGIIVIIIKEAKSDPKIKVVRNEKRLQNRICPSCLTNLDLETEICPNCGKKI